MRKIFWFVVLDLLLFAAAASAQTVSPIIAEGGKGKAKGGFTVTNNGVVPMVVTVQAMTFHLMPEGKAIYLPLESDVAVKLTETSAKIGARQNHVFAYEVQCLSQQPCLIAFLPRMVTGLHTTEGIQLGLIIPHSVYLCPSQEKAKGCRTRVRIAAGIPEGK